MNEVVDRPEDLSAEWISRAFSESGTPFTVTEVRCERVGSGQTGTTYRLHLSYEGPEGPSTLIAKLAGEDKDMRTLVAPGYAAEVGFYSTLAPGAELRTPRCWYAAIAEDHTCFTLLLDDMSSASPGTQVDGCTIGEAEASLRTLVGLHVAWWENPRLYDLSFLMRPDPESAAMMARVMAQASDAFVERYASDLAPEDEETLRQACAVIERWQLTEAAPFSVIHGDYRLDNLLFDAVTGGVTAVDWQTAAIGPPMRDVAYFLGTSVKSEERAASEMSLVRTYHSALVERGVTTYSFERCWDDYRLGQLQGPMITVIGCIYAGAKRTYRSDQMFVAMARRSCAAIRDLGSIELV